MTTPEELRAMLGIENDPEPSLEGLVANVSALQIQMATLWESHQELMQEVSTMRRQLEKKMGSLDCLG